MEPVKKVPGLIAQESEAGVRSYAPPSPSPRSDELGPIQEKLRNLTSEESGRGARLRDFLSKPISSHKLEVPGKSR